MNINFKVIFNRALGCFVAVSELAKTQGKSNTKSAVRTRTSQRTFIRTALSVAVLMAFTNSAMANATGITFAGNGGSALAKFGDTVTIEGDNDTISVEFNPNTKTYTVHGSSGNGVTINNLTVGSDSGSTEAMNLGSEAQKFSIKGENGITTAASDSDVTVKLDDTTKNKIDTIDNKIDSSAIKKLTFKDGNTSGSSVEYNPANAEKSITLKGEHGTSVTLASDGTYTISSQELETKANDAKTKADAADSKATTNAGNISSNSNAITELQKGWKIQTAAAGGTLDNTSTKDATKVGADDTVTFKAGKNITLARTDKEITITAADSAAGVEYYSVNDNNKVRSKDENKDKNKSNKGAYGAQSMAAGINAQALTEYSIALGTGAQAGAILQADGDDLTETAKKGSSAVAIGRNAKAFGTYSVALGINAVTGKAEGSSGSASVAIGSGARAERAKDISIGNAGSKNKDGWGSNIAIGDGVGRDVSGQYNTALGASSGNNVGSDTAISYGNVAIGFKTGYNVRGNSNVALGEWAGTDVGTNFITGERAPTSSSGGNSALGTQAGRFVYGVGNVAAGAGAGSYLKGVGNISFGDGANKNIVGGGNIALGRSAGGNQMGTLNATQDGLDYKDESNNIAIGYVSRAHGTRAIAIGSSQAHNMQGPLADGNDTFAVGAQASAVQTYANAIGFHSSAVAQNAIAFGKNAAAGGDIQKQLTELNLKLDWANGTLNSAQRNLGAYRSQLAAATDENGRKAAQAQIDTWVAKLKEAAVERDAIAAERTALLDSVKENQNAIAIGNSAKAIAKNAIAQGTSAIVYGENGVALGNNAKSGGGFGNNATHANSVAIGNQANAGNISSVAIGDGAVTGTDGKNAISIGKNARTGRYSVQSISMGLNAYSKHFNNITIGADTETDAARAMAIGDNAKTYGTDSLAIGSNATVQNQDSAIVLGANAKVGNKTGDKSVEGANNIAIGRSAIVGNEIKTTDAIALGTSAKANDINTTAIGTGANASKEKGVALGYHTTASGRSSVVIGDASSAKELRSIAIGNLSNVTGYVSTAIGYANNIAQANTMVLGNSVTTTQANSVVLGNASTDRAATTENTATVNGITYSEFAGQGSADKGVVSVGKAGGERQLINVAAGKISADSTDAINGSQLYLTQNALGNVANSTKNILGGDAAVTPEGNITMSNIGGTGKNTVDDAIKAAKTEVVSGNNVTVDNESMPDGHTRYTVNAEKTTVSAADKSAVAVVKGDKDEEDVTNYTVDLTQETKDNIQKGVDANKAIETKGVEFMGDTGTKFARKLGEQTNVKGGAVGELTDGNIGVVADGTDTLTIKLAKMVNLTEDGMLMIGDTVMDKDGLATPEVTADKVNAGTTKIESGKITGLEERNPEDNAADYGKGDNANRAATESAVNVVNDNVNLVDAKLDAAEFGLKGQDGKEVKKNLNNTIDVVGADDNISTKVDDDKLKIQLAKDLKGLTSVEVKGSEPNQSTVINGDTITSTSKDGEVANRTPNKTEFIGGDNDTVTLSNNGLDNGNNKITNVANGVAPTDAVNMSQLTGVSDKVNEGLSFAGDYGATGNDDKNKFTQQLGDMTSFEGGADFNDLSDNNIGVVSNGSDGLAIKLAKNIDLTKEGSVQLGDTMVNNGGLTIAGGPSVTKGGINAGDMPISNVAAGSNPTDAVNMSQLTALGDSKLSSFTIGADSYGKQITVDNGNQHFDIVGYRGPNTANLGGPRDNIYTAINGNKVEIDLTPHLTIGRRYVHDKVGTAGSINVQGQYSKQGVGIFGEYSTTWEKPVIVISDTNDERDPVILSNNKQGTPALDGSESKPRLQISRENPDFYDRPISHEDVATMNDGLLFQGNNKDADQAPIAKKLNKKLTIKGGNDGSNVSDANTYVDNNGSELVVKMAKDLTDIDSITTNGGVVINDKGINAGDKTITNVAPGVNGTDAVNKDQLDAVSTNADSKLADFTVGADNQASADGIVINKANKRFDIVGGESNSITTKVDGNKVVVDLAKDLTVGKPGTNGEAGSIGVAGKDGKDGVSIKGDNGEGKPAIAIAGKDGKDGVTLTTKTDGKPGVNGKDGETKPRLEVNGEEVATLNDGIKYAGDTGSAATALNKTANIVGGVTDKTKLSDNNIGVVAEQDGENAKLTVKLAKDIKGLDSIATNGGVKIDGNGIDAGNKAIANVASGGDVATNAANIGDVKKAAAAASNKVTAGDNIVVTEDKNADGSTTYKVATAKDLNVDSVKAGNTTVNKDGVKVGDNVTLNKDGLTAGNVSVTTAGINAGDNKVTGVANGDISATSNDAVNGSQLFNQGESVKNIIGGDTTYDPSTGTFTNADIGGTGKGNINDAIASVNTASKAAKTEVTEGTNITVTESKGNNGQTIYTVATADKVAFDEVKVGDVVINKDAGINAGNKAIDGVKAGNVAEDSQQAVNGGQLHNTAQSVADALGGGSSVNENGEVTAPSYELTGTGGDKMTANNIGGALNFFTSQVVKPITFAGNEGTHTAQLGSTVQITGADNNISTKVEGNNVKIRLADNLNVKSVTTGNTVMNGDGITINNPADANKNVSLTANGLNNGGNRITNVAPGVADSDVATIGQVKGVAQQVNNNTQAINNLGNRMNTMDRKLKGGIAGNSAMASLPQAYIPGHSMVAVAGGHYSGKSAVALGVSRISDSGHVIIKLNAATNSSGGTNVGAGVGYQW
ncbi:YadA-like family protein, partial [Spirabiliibacterium falconis]|uniref:YadA-like family protein n=1 Tax=Spirabiliibacterium falconis TaxID=572023 RepID=UPI001AAD78DD